MAFNINEMLSTINANGGLSKASKFMVTITPPTILGVANQDLTFFCEAAQLPGLTFQTDDVKMSGYGVYEKRPHGISFSDLPLTFYNDTDGKVLRFFHSWAQAVFNFNSGDNPYGTTQYLPINTFAYPKDYWGTITLDHYDEVSKDGTPSVVVSYTFYQAYPISIQDVSVSWSASDELVRIPVTMTYKWWQADTMQQGTVDARSAARASSLTNEQSTIDKDLKAANELLQVEKAELQYQTNYYAQYLSYY